MFRAGIVGCALLLATVNGAERPNCRSSAAAISSTPSWPAAIAIRRATPTASRSPGQALSGGLAFNTPAFVATAPNITPDRETGIGSWSDAEIKRALVEGSRPDHGRLAGVALAAIMPANFYKALLPDDLDAIIAYLRSVTAGPERSSRSRLQGPGAARSLSRRRRRFQQGHAGRSRQARRLSRHDRPLHGMPLGLVARRVRFQGRPRRAAAGRSRRATVRRRARRQSPSPTSRRIRPRASAPGPTPKSSAPSPTAVGARRAAAEAADGLWLLCRPQGRRSGRYRRLSAHRSRRGLRARLAS